ncbi:unnamed protein product, partial [Lampetra fluviatilis]
GIAYPRLVWRQVPSPLPPLLLTLGPGGGDARCGLWVASGWFGFPLTATVSGERKLLKRRLAGPPLRRLSLKVRTSRGVSTSAVAAAVGGDRGGAWPTAVTFCGVHGAASSRARPCCCC